MLRLETKLRELEMRGIIKPEELKTEQSKLISRKQKPKLESKPKPTLNNKKSRTSNNNKRVDNFEAEYLHSVEDSCVGISHYIRAVSLDDLYKFMYNDKKMYKFVMQLNENDDYTFFTTPDYDASKLLIINYSHGDYPEIIVNNTGIAYEDYYSSYEYKQKKDEKSFDYINESYKLYTERKESIYKLTKGNYYTLKNVSFETFKKICEYFETTCGDYGDIIFDISTETFVVDEEPITPESESIMITKDSYFEEIFVVFRKK
jgi:hypothetical protein